MFPVAQRKNTSMRVNPEHLVAGGNVDVRGLPIWIINVHGPGGVGRSALVNWAAHEFYERRSFEGIIHLTAKDTELTAAGIRPSGRSLYSLEDLLRWERGKRQQPLDHSRTADP